MRFLVKIRLTPDEKNNNYLGCTGKHCPLGRAAAASTEGSQRPQIFTECRQSFTEMIMALRAAEGLGAASAVRISQ
jgi:hypothetical protein